MTGLTEPEASPWFCWSHYQLEEPPDGSTILQCFECKHVFTSPDELVRGHLAIYAEMGIPLQEPISVDDVFACPMCAHDF